jgi:LysM repeat protein
MHTQHINRVLIVLTFIALLVALIPPVTLAAPPEQGSVVYIVRWGDTLFSIARRFGTTVPALMTANNLTSEYIYAGQMLTIPVGAPLTPPPPPPGFDCKYTVAYRDTVYSIAWRYKIQYPLLMQANNLYSTYLRVGMELKVPCTTPAPSNFPVYEVKGGDNLFRIAVQYETSIYAIALVNGLWSTHWIYPGQKLVIPYGGTVKYPPDLPTRVPYTPAPSSTPGPTKSPTPTATVKVDANVSMESNAFTPVSLTINRGGVVLWKNNDTKAHTVTSGVQPNHDSKFRSGTLNPGQTWLFKFDTAGIYQYFSEGDTGMIGTITVQ